jgi:hypothetical protein
MLMVECPSISETTLGCIPCISSNVAYTSSGGVFRTFDTGGEFPTSPPKSHFLHGETQIFQGSTIETEFATSIESDPNLGGHRRMSANDSGTEKPRKSELTEAGERQRIEGSDFVNCRSWVQIPPSAPEFKGVHAVRCEPPCLLCLPFCPQLAERAPKQPFHRISRRLAHLGQHMPVGGEREGHRGMAEHFRHHQRLDPFQQQERCRGVAQIMRATISPCRSKTRQVIA